MLIRREEPRDYAAVENLTREAFWNVYRPGCTEHYVLHVLRDDPAFVPPLDYVIEEDGAPVAHIAYAKGTLQTDGETQELLLFGPVSVLPSRQKQGYGSKLIEFTLEQARALGYPAVVITGDPGYYGRFGFEPASKYGICYAGADGEFPFFMVKFLDESARGNLRGVYSDPPCYFADPAAVEKFDRAFPPKIKEKRPGQLE